jgi:DNA-binding protein HU-beta
MNKNELIEKMVKDAGLTKNVTAKVLDTLLEVVTAELKKKGKITLVGFGTFKTIDKKAKKGRNPKTGAVISIPKKRVPKFVPGKELKLLVK